LNRSLAASLDIFEKRMALPLLRIEPSIIQPMYWLTAVPGQGHDTSFTKDLQLGVKLCSAEAYYHFAAACCLFFTCTVATKAYSNSDTCVPDLKAYLLVSALKIITTYH
jgi:hypothetical protein